MLKRIWQKLGDFAKLHDRRFFFFRKFWVMRSMERVWKPSLRMHLTSGVHGVCGNNGTGVEVKDGLGRPNDMGLKGMGNLLGEKGLAEADDTGEEVIMVAADLLQPDSFLSPH